MITHLLVVPLLHVLRPSFTFHDYVPTYGCYGDYTTHTSCDFSLRSTTLRSRYIYVTVYLPWWLLRFIPTLRSSLQFPIRLRFLRYGGYTRSHIATCVTRSRVRCTISFGYRLPIPDFVDHTFVGYHSYTTVTFSYCSVRCVPYVTPTFVTPHSAISLRSRYVTGERFEFAVYVPLPVIYVTDLPTSLLFSPLMGGRSVGCHSFHTLLRVDYTFRSYLHTLLHTVTLPYVPRCYRFTFTFCLRFCSCCLPGR